MDIILSEIQIVPVKPYNGLLAFCTFVVNNSFFCGDIAIYSRLDGTGYRLAYPSKTLANGSRFQIFHPINKQSAQAIEKQVIDKYLELMQGENING